jgi:hypothetical protein
MSGVMPYGAVVGSAADLTQVTPTLESRSISFENPTGARGAGGTAHGGRKGSPNRWVAAGERVVLADITGPGTIRHLWMTIPPLPPEVVRAQTLEMFYNGSDEPSISVPLLDFFGLPWGRPVHVATALTTVSEGRGFNSFIPMPFTDSVRVEIVNGADRRVLFFFQLDYTLEPSLPPGTGFLHASYRRENPTTLCQDFVIAGDLAGPGRFLGCVVGVRVLDGGTWYGEGEVKIYLDGDEDLPTICGTGLEDYVGTAWGMGAHQTPFMGAPLVVRPPDRDGGNPDLVGFYRWHVLDPIMFADSLRVTIQQIGWELFRPGQEDELATKQAAGNGWLRPTAPEVLAMGIAERVDDYCATAFVMCATPQPVPRVTADAALAEVARLPYEPVPPGEWAMTGGTA